MSSTNREVIRRLPNLMFTIALLAAFSMPLASHQALDDPERFQQVLADAQSMLKRGEYTEAIRVFDRANKLAKKRSPEAFLGIARASLALAKHKDARKNAERALKYTEDPILRASAYNLIGSAWIQGGKLKEKSLRSAEKAIRTALEFSPDSAVFHFNLGHVLLGLDRRREGVESLRQYLSLDPEGDLAADAKKMIRDPGRVRLSRAPNFTLKTSEAEKISLADLEGKVVLLDFWATWCGPCQYSVPYLRQLNQRLEGKDFVLISISEDDYVKTWRKYVQKEQMIWHQYFDHSNKLSRIFRINAFPTFILIDGEGLVRVRFSGWGKRVEKTLAGEIEKSLERLEYIE